MGPSQPKVYGKGIVDWLSYEVSDPYTFFSNARATLS